jgi:hypothetical protein
MAGRGLGTLTLDLAIRLAQFTGPLDKAGRDLDKRTRAMEKRAQEFGRQLGTALKVGVGIAATALGIYIKNTIEAEKVQAQLTARLNDTAGAAGRSLRQLNEQAEKLQSLTVFDDESIGQAQAALLTFTQIQGLNFDRTIEAATDLATVMGTDVAAAAKVLGKALSDPEKGIGALRKAGITLTEDQKALVKELQATGDMAGAQGVILDALAGKMGTAAEAARDTLGGALQGLQNSFNNLLEGDGGSAGVRDATAAINDFSASLNSPEARQNVDAIINALVRVAGFVGDLTGAFVKSAQQIGNTIGLIGQYASALSDYTSAAIRGDAAAATVARQRFLNDYKQFVEETKRVRDGAGSPAGGLVEFIDPPPPRRKGAEDGAAARAEAAKKAIKDASRANSEAKKAAAEAAREQAAAERELEESVRKAAEAQADFTRQLEDLIAQQGGPLAESQLRYKREEQELRDLHKNSSIPVTKELEQAITLLHEARDKDAETIRKNLDTGEQQLQQMREELELLQAKSTAERDRIAFLQANPTATGDQADEAARIGAQIDETRQAIAAMDDFRATFEDSVVDVVTGAKSIADAFKSMADAVVQQITRIIAQQLTTSLFGSPGTLGGGSSGSLLGSFFGALTGGTKIPGFAGGTDFAPGGFSVVGERGPEIVKLPRGSQVVPNHKLGGGKFELHFHGAVTEKVAQQAANRVSRQVAFAQRGGR